MRRLLTRIASFIVASAWLSCAHVPDAQQCNPDPVFENAKDMVCIDQAGLRMCGYSLPEGELFLVRVACNGDWYDYDELVEAAKGPSL